MSTAIGTIVVLIGAGMLVLVIVVVVRNARRGRLPRPGAGAALAGPPTGPPPGEPETDPEVALHWQQLAPGDQITITDVVAFADALQVGRGSVHGSDYQVVQVIHGVAPDGDGARVTLGLLDDPAQPLLLAVEERAGAFSLRLFHRPEGAPSGTRADLLDAGAFWLFDAPQNPDRFRPADLQWVGEFVQEGRGDGTSAEELRYTVDRDAGPGRYVAGVQPPAGPDGNRAHPLQVVRYRAASATADPWIYVCERGGVGADVGGWVEVWQGCEIRASDISRTPQGFAADAAAAA